MPASSRQRLTLALGYMRPPSPFSSLTDIRSKRDSRTRVAAIVSAVDGNSSNGQTGGEEKGEMLLEAKATKKEKRTESCRRGSWADEEGERRLDCRSRTVETAISGSCYSQAFFCVSRLQRQSYTQCAKIQKYRAIHLVAPAAAVVRFRRCAVSTLCTGVADQRCPSDGRTCHWAALTETDAHTPHFLLVHQMRQLCITSSQNVS